MHKETISYTDFNGNRCCEDFFFNISVKELMEFQKSIPGGVKKYIDELRESDNPEEVFDLFSKIIGLGYGEKTADGKRFVKSEDITDSFFESAAFDALITKFFSDPSYAAKFIEAMLPTAALQAASGSASSSLLMNA